MNANAWRKYYEINRRNRHEPDWKVPCQIPRELMRKLAISLSHFQLGETGGGTFLLREASKESNADDLAALQLYIQEEQEHARLLACMVRRLGGELVRHHWTHRLFKTARRGGGFRFEIQILLIAEMVGTAYYELVRDGVDDPALLAAIGLMLHDEAGHVAFHLDRLRERWRTYLPLERTAWSLQFQMLLLTAMRAAWLDHGPCLRALGFGWDEFACRTRRVAIHFLDGLEGQPRVMPDWKPLPESIAA